MSQGTEKLLDCLRKGPAGTRLASLRQYRAADWEEIVAAAERHGVVPLLYHSMKGCLDGLDLPRDVTEEMRRKYYVAAARNTRLYHELHRILDLLTAQGVPIIVLKGAYLADMVYGNLALRGMGDVDLLVSQDDLKLVDDILLKAGAQPEERNRVITARNFHFPYVLLESKLRVEIHWKLSWLYYPGKIDYGGIWNRAQRWQLGQTEVLALAPEDLLVHACLHAARHADTMSISMLCDIAEVVSYFESQLDWPAICVRSRQWGVSRAVYVLLRLAHELLGAAISEEQLAALRPLGFEEKRFLLILRHMLGVNADVGTAKVSPDDARLMRIKGLRGTIFWILQQAFSPRGQIAFRYPAAADSWRIFLYYPVWIKYLLLKYGNTIWALARGDAEVWGATERLNELISVCDWLLSG